MTHKQALPDAAIKASSEQLEKALSSEERVLTGHTDSVTCMILDESQQHVPYMLLITGSWDRTLRIWNLDSGECDGVLQGATASVRCMQRYGGDVLIAGEMKGSISLWNWKTRQLLRTIDAHPEDHAVMSIDVKGDILVSGGTDAKIKVSDLNNLDSEPHVIKSKHGAVNQVRVVPRFGEAAKIDELSAVSAAMSEKLAGAYLLLGYTDGTVQLLDPLTSNAIEYFAGHDSDITCLKVIPSAQLPEDLQPYNQGGGASGLIFVTGSVSGPFKLRTSGASECLMQYNGHTSAVWAVEAMRGLLVSAGHDKTVKVWDMSKGDCLLTVPPTSTQVTSLTLGSSKILAGYDDGNVKVWPF